MTSKWHDSSPGPQILNYFTSFDLGQAISRLIFHYNCKYFLNFIYLFINYDIVNVFTVRVMLYINYLPETSNKSFCCIAQNMLILLVPTFFVNYMSKLKNWSVTTVNKKTQKEKKVD